LQQMWFYGNTGDFAPTYYLQSDAPLYYYSFTDAHIAMAYKALPAEKQARLDPMITGFNPADMYATDHIRRVLTTFPGVFVGIGEFTIHKEFVSAKIAGEIASLTNPALDRVLDLAAETGLIVLLHNDINMPFPKPGQEPYMLAQMKELFMRHQDATIIWAHLGVGRVVRPLEQQAAIVEKICTDPGLSHVYMDISWDEVAKYITASQEAIRRSAELINRYPDRFLFGTDVVAPSSADALITVYDAYGPLWEKLTPEAFNKVTRGNYEHLFNQARQRVRAWETSNLQTRSKQ
jgi:predicted TIM-barrel fold metal-dependent hydrolase